METETVDTGGELELYQPPPVTLFGTSDPTVALQRMSDVATTLVDVIRARKLYVRIRGHEHITAEGWTTLGGMLGIVPIVTWTRPNETGDGYLARVEARTLDGRIVGAAESECSRAEDRWRTADPYALRSMAQTRAIGRALRGPLGQIVVLAGYEPAGAEEVPEQPLPPREEPSALPPQARPTQDQLNRLRTLLELLQMSDQDVDFQQRCRDAVNANGGQLTHLLADQLIHMLEHELPDQEPA
jgi:hypothetical protein